jgi:ribulose-phosphate 3-epimerase
MKSCIFTTQLILSSMSIIAPSILAADFKYLAAEIQKINESPAEWIHFDVMDGQNVPNISFGFPILEAIKPITNKTIDAHLMIQNPHQFIPEFIQKGVSHISIPIENNSRLRKDLELIKSLGATCGIALDPDTSIELIIPWLDIIDVVLIMSVQPGFGGQSFIEATYQKVARAKEIVSEVSRKIWIEVDGGVSVSNSSKLKSCGAEILVSGSALFKSDDFNGYVNTLLNN